MFFVKNVVKMKIPKRERERALGFFFWVNSYLDVKVNVTTVSNAVVLLSGVELLFQYRENSIWKGFFLSFFFFLNQKLVFANFKKIKIFST